MRVVLVALHLVGQPRQIPVFRRAAIRVPRREGLLVGILHGPHSRTRLGTRLAGLTRSTGRRRPYGSGRLYSPDEKKGLSRSWSVGPRQGNCEHKPCYGKPFINADYVDSRGGLADII